jgi:hypothetical protein
MKLRIVALAIFLGILLVGGKSATAQLNCFSYSTDLAEYTNVSYYGASIYTTVGIDGSQQMLAWGQCAQFVGYAVHTPYIFNRLSTSGQSAGGWFTGNGVCASCYISFGSSQLITPLLPDEQVEFENEVMADCSFGSTIFDSGPDFQPISRCRAEPRINASCQQIGNRLDLNASYGVFGSNCAYTSTVYSTSFSGASCGGVPSNEQIVESGNNCTVTTSTLSQIDLNGNCIGFCDVTNSLAYTQSRVPAGCSRY